MLKSPIRAVEETPESGVHIDMGPNPTFLKKSICYHRFISLLNTGNEPWHGGDCHATKKESKLKHEISP
jgi:hypothetical protein